MTSSIIPYLNIFYRTGGLPPCLGPRPPTIWIRRWKEVSQRQSSKL